MTTNYTRRKVGPSDYEVLDEGKVVGLAGKSGTHLDDYPWDWMLADGVEPVPNAVNGHRPDTTGVAETLAKAMNQIGYSLGRPYGRFGDES